MKRITLFEEYQKNCWQDEWNEMPEYNNVREQEPVITVKIRFITLQDFEDFKEKLKVLLETSKPFDGMQRKTEKSITYPPREKSSKYICQ